MITKLLFTAIVIAIFLQRSVELRLSKRNAAHLLNRGGRMHSENLLPAVKLLQLSWFLAMIAEVWLLNRPLIPWLAAIAVLATATGQYLRYLSMQALGKRWTLPIITLPGIPAVDSGIYSYLRHPNWLGVILEITAVPLIHSAYLTAIAFTVANAFLISQRVQSEERALTEDNHYAEIFAGRSRFIPAMRSRSRAKKRVNISR